VKRTPTIFSLSHLPTLILEVQAKHLAQRRIVFGQQDARFVAFLGICFAHVGNFATMTSVESVNLGSRPTIADALGIEVLEIGADRVTGRMPVDGRTHQPYGLLHGGASVVLAETLGSVGSHALVAESGRGAVGIEVNANHLRGVSEGWVHGEAQLVHKGGRLHVWSIELRDDAGKLVCTSRLTVMIVPNHG
jgi:1,4-dihydroxy-2-naphthoyl-CoA hydrolase